jgi:hypothetical protein
VTAGAATGGAAAGAELGGGEAVPAELALWSGVAGAGAGAGVELLHPLKTRVATRAKLATKTGHFSRMGISI